MASSGSTVPVTGHQYNSALYKTKCLFFSSVTSHIKTSEQEGKVAKLKLNWDGLHIHLNVGVAA